MHPTNLEKSFVAHRAPGGSFAPEFPSCTFVSLAVNALGEAYTADSRSGSTVQGSSSILSIKRVAPT
jgi:hypothetical protein